MLSTQAANRKDVTSGIGRMGHRHFATIATIIREYQGEPVTQKLMAGYFADRLDETNENFDRKRFIAACAK